MRKPFTITARVFAVVFIAAMLFTVALPSLFIPSLNSFIWASGPGGHGCKEGNLLPNCGMDNFVPVAQGQAPAGWTPYVLKGSLAMDPSPDTFWGAPSLRMWSDGDTFVAGIYTQATGLTPGATYYASMGWGAPMEPRDSFSRRLGIDPTGGVDPNSPTVVWGPTLRGPGVVLNDSNPGMPNIDVSAVARGSTVTVFVWVDHSYSTGQNQIFIDAVGLYQESAPLAPVVPDTPMPTAAAAPQATAAPTMVKAIEPTKAPATSTATRTATATAPPTFTATLAPTETPTATSTRTAAPTPEDTPTPSVTPSSTLPPRPRATVAPAATEVASQTSAPPALLFGGVGALGGAILLAVAMVVRRKDNDAGPTD